MRSASLGLLLLASNSFASAAIVDRTPELHRRDLAHSDPFYPSPWMNPEAKGWEDAYVKAKAFVSQLTLLEKINLTTGVGWQGEQCVGNTGSVPRLGLKSICLQDGPVGLRFNDYNSVFPAGMTAAATFDKNLLYRRGRAMGEENKGKGVHVILGPVAGPIGRMPEGGRNWEGFSPDPVLTGIAMASTINGIQDAGVIACAKHFVANEQEHFRQVPEAQDYGYNIAETLSSNIDDKTMHELYLWPFADAVRAGVGSVMCSYQQINNSYACQNSKVVNDLLKNELGFQGFVMSDWSAQHTGVATAVAGLDMSMPGDVEFNSGRSYWGTNLTIAVLNGTLPEYRVDDMAMRIMAAYFKVGLTLDEPPVNFDSWTLDTYGPVHYAAEENYEQINWHVDVRGDHGKLIREIAAAGTVLLKNTGSLPLQKPKFLAVIGEDAGNNPAGPNGCSDRGCDNGTLAMAWGSGSSSFSYLITPDFALQSRALQDGSRYESILSNYEGEATEALVSQENATAIVFVNADSGEGYISVDGNEGDRQNLTLWKDGDVLVKNVSSWCSNTIVVIHSVGPVLLTDWYNNPNITAILFAGIPGQESGNALVDVLYGDVNPSGRTPFTWGATRESYGTDVLYEPNNGEGAPQQDFSEGVLIDYRHFDRADSPVIYEFGHGLSYTTFKYANLRVARSEARPYEPTAGETSPAPTFGNFSTNPEDYVFPHDQFRYIEQYLYPYLNTTDLQESSGDADYGKKADEFLPPHALDSDAQPLLRSSGKNSPGGNSGLYDTLYTVTADVTNTGSVAGHEVAQLYLSLGGPDDPKVVLRGFDRIPIEAGHTVQFRAELTRRDLSNWDPAVQDWVISEHPKKVYVGRSSRKLDLSVDLP